MPTRRGAVVAWTPARRWVSGRVALLPLVCLLAVTLPHLGQGDWRTDSARYAAAGLQAWRDGLFWTLHTHPDQPWFNKPPLVMWIHGLALHLGGVSLLAARAPSVLAAAGCVLATSWLVRAFDRREVALGAGLVLALTYEFFRRTREVSLDLWQALFLVLAAGMFARAVLRGGRAWPVGAGVFVGLALMSKPLVGLGAIVLLGAWGLTVAPRRAVAGFGLACAAAVLVAGPWHVSMAVVHADAFVGQYFGSEIADRAAGQIRTQPPWYYAALLARTYWPWAAGIALAGLASRRACGRASAGLRLAVVWSVGWTAAMSLFPDKAPRYLVLVYPGLAYLAAWGLSRRRSPLARRAVAIGVAVFATGAIVFAALPVRVQAPANPAWARAIAVVREAGGRPVVAVGVDTNQLGRFYLAGLPWPRSIDDAEDAPPDALILRTPAVEDPAPTGERVVFREERVMLSERGGGG